MLTFVESFKRARNAAAPFVAVRTSDPPATLAQLETVIKTVTLQGVSYPANLLYWDLARGCQWLRPAQPFLASDGETAGIVNGDGMSVCVQQFLERPMPETQAELQDVADELELKTANLPEVLARARRFPPNTVLFVMNYQLFANKPDVIQATINLRDLFKADKRMLVPVTTFGYSPDTILRDAMVVLDDPLPDRSQLKWIASACFDNVGLVEVDSEKAVDAIAGLAAFPAEQAVSMSLDRNRSTKEVYLDMEGLWERKRKLVAQTPGLSIYAGKETFDDLGGLAQIKTFLRKYLRGRRPPFAIFFTDEIEKQVGGSSSDLSGIGQMQMGKVLTWTQEKAADGHMKVAGVLCIGHPGAGKSAIAKALGNEAGVPCLVGDLGDTKNSLVGSSEERMASMLNVVDSVGQGSILWIATCNGVERLSPEFLGRFALAQFFFDLPDAEERDAIWQVYLRKYKLDPAQPRPNDEGWVGREIEACCYKAWMLNTTLEAAGKYVVVSSIASAERVQTLRNSASGKYLSATYDGYYRIGRESRGKPAFSEPQKGRNITV